jgi:hypothetical protein
MDEFGAYLQTGWECRAGKANQYVNVYFFRLANERIVNDERREGME